jgi:hypothetical protein
LKVLSSPSSLNDTSSTTQSSPRGQNDDANFVDNEDESDDDHYIPLTNYYAEMPEEEPNNPHLDDHNIQLPFRMVVVGASGTGKTNAIVNLIEKINPPEDDPTFDQILIITQCQEGLYDSLVERNSRVLVLFGMNSIPSLDDEGVFLPNQQYLLVLEDMILEKDQDVIKPYYQRGRKKGVSVIYQTQKFFDSKI